MPGNPLALLDAISVIPAPQGAAGATRAGALPAAGFAAVLAALGMTEDAAPAEPKGPATPDAAQDSALPAPGLPALSGAAVADPAGKAGGPPTSTRAPIAAAPTVNLGAPPDAAPTAPLTAVSPAAERVAPLGTASPDKPGIAAPASDAGGRTSPPAASSTERLAKMPDPARLAAVPSDTVAASGAALAGYQGDAAPVTPAARPYPMMPAMPAAVPAADTAIPPSPAPDQAPPTSGTPPAQAAATEPGTDQTGSAAQVGPGAADQLQIQPKASVPPTRPASPAAARTVPPKMRVTARDDAAAKTPAGSGSEAAPAPTGNDPTSRVAALPTIAPVQAPAEPLLPASGGGSPPEAAAPQGNATPQLAPVAAATHEAAPADATITWPPPQPDVVATNAASPERALAQMPADASAASSVVSAPAMSSAPPAAPAASQLGRAAPAAQMAPALLSLGGGATGAQHLTLRLLPADLGTVQIRIDRPTESPARVEISVSRPETLTLLLRDQTQLQRTLDQAGVPAEGRTLTFNLSGQDADSPSRQHGGFAQANAQGQPDLGAASDEEMTDTEADMPPLPPTLTGWFRAGLDITA